MANYKIDAAHSEIKFQVRHMMITNVTGTFLQFDATMDSEKPDFSDANISFEADINSITTNQEQRDGHLKSADFFDATNHPKLTFTSTGIDKVDDNDFKLHGNITLRGVTRPITLDVEYGGTATDGYGQTKSGFEMKGKINRKDFGLNWSALTEAGGLVVSDDVKLLMQVQMIKQ
jgi:polyisoprenoid-binding protein YceI